MTKNITDHALNHFVETNIVADKDSSVSSEELTRRFNAYYVSRFGEKACLVNWHSVLSKYFDVERVRGIKYEGSSDRRGIKGISLVERKEKNSHKLNKEKDLKLHHLRKEPAKGISVKPKTSERKLYRLKNGTSKEIFAELFIAEVIDSCIVRAYTSQQLQYLFERFCDQWNVLSFRVDDWDYLLEMYCLPETLKM